MFKACGWQVAELPDGEDTDAIAAAIAAAKTDLSRPSIIIVNTNIAHGTPKQSKASTHGETLGAENVAAMREFYKWEHKPFVVPEDVYAHFASLAEGYARQQAEYEAMVEEYRAKYPELYDEWLKWRSSELPKELLKDARLASASKPMATRAFSGDMLNIIAEYLPNLFGGSAGAPSRCSAEKQGSPRRQRADRH